MSDDSTMTGVWLEGGSLSLRRDLPAPDPGEGEVLLAPVLAGICGTDHQLASGYADFRGVPGHEFVAIVLEGPDEWIGERVVAEINVGCGNCEQCRAGGPEHCAERSVVGIRGHQGAFAERLTLPARNLHPLPAAVATELGVFVEPLAAALRIREQLGPLEDRDVLVVGDGRLGQLVARALVLEARSLRVHGRHERKLRLLRERGIPAVEDLPGARAADVVIECSGSASGFAAARGAVRPGGTIVLKSTAAVDPHPVDLSSLVVDEIRLLGSRCGPLRQAIELLTANDLGLFDLIDARFPLADAPEAFRHSARRGSLKVLLEIWQP